MPIVFKLKEDYGTDCYLRSDLEQIPKTFIGVILGPGHVVYLLRDGVETLEAYDFEVTFEPDEIKRLSLKSEE